MTATASPSTPTRNRHCDAVRAEVASRAFPCAIDPHDLQCAAILAQNARAMLAEAFRLLRQDNVLRVQAETAGIGAKRLLGSINARRGVV